MYNFDWFSIATDERTVICGTAQLLTFIGGIDLNFNVSEELVELLCIVWRELYIGTIGEPGKDMK